MKNGEGTVETESFEVTSLPAVNDPLEDDDELLPWDGQKSDGGDDTRSSQYSSCGESSFDRYCSANSVMGTPSVCSSVYEFPDSEFGSLKSFQLGGEGSILKKSAIDRKLFGFSEPGGSSREVMYEKTSHEDEMGDGFWRKSEEFEFIGSSEKFLNHSDYTVMGEGFSPRDNSIIEKVKLGDNDDQTVSLGFHRGISEFTDDVEDPGVLYMKIGLKGPGIMECKEGMIEGCLDDDETSSRHEYSEGEDSMFGGASDGEQTNEPYFVKNTNYAAGAENNADKQELFMTSNVTYGLNDWEDFIQETEETPSMTAQNLFQLEEQDVTKDEIGCLDSTLSFNVGGAVPSKGKPDNIVDIPIPVNKTHDIIVPMHLERPCIEPFHLLKKLCESEEAKHVESSPVIDNQTYKHSDSVDPESFPISAEDLDHYPITIDATLQMELVPGIIEEENGRSISSANKVTANFANNHSSASSKGNDWKGEFVEKSVSLPLDNNTQPTVIDTIPVFEDHFPPNKKENAELNGFYDEMVHEMEEILLDTATSPVSRSSHSNRTSSALPSRDGGSTASTSGTYDANPLRIKDIEVVGARQRKGDVSLSERLVGVKEYTVYQIRVWSSDDVWVIERRYRDFFSLYRLLKKLFADQGWILPAPWLSVEQESNKIFGSASPDVIVERSVLMQECLRSIIHNKYSTRLLNAMLTFLWPSKSPGSPAKASITPSLVSSKSTDVLGKTVSLIVQIHPYKSMQQMLDAQCHTCAGCHNNFNAGLTRITDIARTLGWGKPRLCEYSGQLFCSTCHTNDMAVLPAKVLHQWDFTQYPVSQVAKSYLESIHDKDFFRKTFQSTFMKTCTYKRHKPMLCVSAVNPFLFLRVPALQHVTTVRKRIGAMIPYVRCPFRRSIYKALGTRRYLLEGTDFFALRDLIDLSKGMFAALPVMVETISRKILEHIMEQCLICCDTGIPCNARQACNDPSALIFPFQEEEIERCGSCNSVFHSHCFSKITACPPCGARLKPEEYKGSSMGIVCESGNKRLSFLSRGRKGGGETTRGLISGFVSKMMPQRSLGHKNVESKGNDTVILMGALPSNTL